jgi:hypothetical protein
MSLKDTDKNRATVRAELQLLRTRLGEIAASLDTVDHDAARALHKARDSMHEAWQILRAAPRN